MWIDIKDIHKHFDDIKANDGISLSIAEGTIHGLIGENGAGKSTLMKILAGFTRPTSGRILVNGSPINCKTPAEACGLGIGMLCQDPFDFPQLSVLDNFMLGSTKGFFPRLKTQKNKYRQIALFLGFNPDTDRLVKDLTIGERQQIEIIRLLSKGISLLILDEPTTGLSSIQKDNLFSALKKLAARGTTIILVSHRLEDIESLCDKITVLRRGFVSGEMVKPFDTEKILLMMFGLKPPAPARTGLKRGKPLLTFNQVSALGSRAGLKNVSTVIRQREIVGLAGLEGSGQGLFLHLAAGLKQAFKGSITPDSKNIKINFLPASRLEEGLISSFTIAEHMALINPMKSFFISRQEAYKRAEHKIDQFHIMGRPESTVESLSGGNQQRLLLSLLPESPQLLLLENPTRGLDIEAANWVWQYLQQYCTQLGTGIVFSSSELDEILLVADRVLVFSDGRIIKDIRTEETDIHELACAMAGPL